MKETLTKLRGSTGESLRANAKALGNKIRQDVSKGGAAYANMKELAFLSAIEQ